MASIERLFATDIYRAPLGGRGVAALLADLAHAIRQLALDDAAGRRWCAENAYRGYTSYASLDDLPKRDPEFNALVKVLDKHAAAFARELHLDLERRKLKLDSIWINVLEPNGVHTSHIHPHSVLSGTYYVEVPNNASALKLEDPRHAMMMAAPKRSEDAPEAERTFVYVAPKAGEVLMWESFIRHEVTMNQARKSRISVSFNYGW